MIGACLGRGADRSALGLEGLTLHSRTGERREHGCSRESAGLEVRVTDRAIPCSAIHLMLQSR